MVSQRKVGSFEMSGPLPQQSPSSPLRAGGGGGMHVGSGGGMGGEEGHLLDLPLGSSSNHNHHHHKRSLRSSPRSLRHVLQVVRTGSSRLFAKNNNHDNKPEMDWDTPQIDWKRAGQQLGLFQQMSIPYYQESIRARWLLVGLLVLTFFNSGVSVLFSYVGKDFWNALAAKDAEQFYTVLVRYVGALAVGAPVATLYYYQREQLAVHWREWMTARTFDLYRSNQVYYKLERDRLSIDNPDQRITEDVKSFTSFSLSLLITMITSVIDLCSFSLILWSIYPQLFGAIILYAAAGTVVTTVLGKKLVRLNFQQLRREADLRYALVRLRDNAESIAFYAGEDLEGQAVETRLEGVMDNRRNINVAQRNVEFFTNAYRYMVQILPVAVVAPQVRVKTLVFVLEFAVGTKCLSCPFCSLD